MRMNDVQGTMDHDAADSPESQLVGAPIQERADLVETQRPDEVDKLGDGGDTLGRVVGPAVEPADQGVHFGQQFQAC